MSSSYHHKKFARLRIPREKIVSSTNNFSEANLIRYIDDVREYKGQLLWSDQLVDIAVQVWPNDSEMYDDFFWREVSMLSTLKHENLASLLGFVDEDDHEKILIYKHYAKGELTPFLKDPTLTWIRRLQIFVGVAQALSYLYHEEGRDFTVIHCDIRSHNILIDDHWSAKLCGFHLSLKQIAATRNPVRCSQYYSYGGRYDDPAFAESGYASHKFDIYPFGVLLFEGLTGEKSEKDRPLAPLAKSWYEGGRLDDMILRGLQIQMDPQSLKIFSETSYYCLKEQLSKRPNIHQILKKLTEALECQRKHENDLMLKPYSMVEGTTNFKSLKGKNLEHLKIPFNDIVSATADFAKTHLIGAGGFGEVYKAELEHFDSKHLLSSEEKHIGEHRKKRSTVAIKRILIREDNQGEEGFLAEIELLTSCKHPNIVSLLGFCEEGPHKILVYEHVSNGSLEDHLGSTNNFTNLTWVQRIKICIDIAHGLNYLHTKVDGERRIIHRDIKTGNILLGENWEAKIADFGLSKFRPENKQQENNTLYTQHIAGTPFYLDPEYDKKGKLKSETDIYSFGVVLFEILSGKYANDAIFIKEDNNGIAPVARRRFKDGTIKDMVDPRLKEETGKSIFSYKGPNLKSLDAFSKIAYQCVSETQAERPTAQVIITKLEEVLSFHFEIDNRNIHTNNILLDDDWTTKICGFSRSFKCPINTDVESVINNEYGYDAYCDPVYAETGFLTTKSDIYSFGLLLFEILCGGVLIETIDGKQQLDPLAKTWIEERTLHECVFKDIKQQIAPKSMTAFQMIAYQCLHRERDQRPTAHEVLLQLMKALEFQMDYEIWKHKLPKDYEEIFRMSKYRDIYSSEREKDLYDLLCEGILLQEGKVLFTQGRNGERNEMISARTFSYINHCHGWRCVPQSRFPVVAQMFDISNLRIKIKTKVPLLSPRVHYRVYLVFKFCDPRKFVSKPLYVNLKYKNRSKFLHSYFATWRDNEWMMIELCQFLNDKKDIVYNFLLESFSRYYCGNKFIYIEGIEFRAIDNVKYENMLELNEVHQFFESDLDTDLLQQFPTNNEEMLMTSKTVDDDDKLFWSREMNGKKHLMLSAKAALYDYSDVKLFKTTTSAQSRFPTVIELLPQQVLRINCMIKSQMLSQDTNYSCYLVYNLSEKCHGLHCPVKVRDLLHRNNKEVKIIYFRSPSPWNLHDTHQAPQRRGDGWMEVNIWKFNFTQELKNDRLRVNLKLISYEGTMSGLIVYGLDFRPM